MPGRDLPFRLSRGLRIAATLGLALVAAWGCQALRLPLPWMLGPLAVTALFGIAGAPLAASSRLRNLGQAGIGVALGLYFTPAVLSLMPALAPALGAGVLWALAIGFGFYRFLLRSPGLDPANARATAFFSGAIGGASEMAVLADRHGGAVDRVAAAHSMRLLLVITLIPFGFQAAGLHGADPLPAALVDEVRPAGLLVLLALAAAGVVLMRALRAPNAFVLGALASTALLAGSGVELSALPRPASDAAQLFIGVALGTRFTPAFVRAAPRWLGAVALGTLVMIVASALFAWGLSFWVGLHPATLLLATSPGGIAEMAITAKVLQLGVPVVTTFHVVRYVAVLTLTPLIYRRELRRANGTARAG